jgi:hypothetical protein
MNDMEYQAGGSDRQLEGLLEHNADRTDLDLADRAGWCPEFFALWVG